MRQNKSDQPRGEAEAARADLPQDMSSPVMGYIGPLAVELSCGIRTQVPSPWFFPLT